MTAVTIAVLWANQLLEQFFPVASWLPVSLHFDCLAAGFTAAGQWTARTHLDLQHRTRALVHWVESRFQTQFAWEHVYAHSGHPWNEAADAIAWAALAGWIEATSFTWLDNVLGHANSLHWLWMLEEALRGHPSIPPIVNGIMRLNARQPLSPSMRPALHPMHMRQQLSHPPCLRQTVLLKCATANVLTLHPALAQHGSGITARLESLLRSFANEQILLIGAQETRSKLDGHRVVDDFHILSAPATDKGVGGCQLWIRRCWPTTDGTLRILQADLRILHASAQRLIVQIDKQDLRLILISAHAPSCASPEVTTAWWSATTNAIPSTKRHWPVIALLDANARLGSNVSHCVGPHGADQENVAGECFHQWLHDLDLVVPQTFEAFHTGAHCTWTHSTGAKLVLITLLFLDVCFLMKCALALLTWTFQSAKLTMRVLPAHFRSLAFWRLQAMLRLPMSRLSLTMMNFLMFPGPPMCMTMRPFFSVGCKIIVKFAVRLPANGSSISPNAPGS